MRLAAALEIKNAAEKEIQEKEGSARKALAEQEAIMDKVVQESKLLQKEAEENSKVTSQNDFEVATSYNISCYVSAAARVPYGSWSDC